MRPDGLRAELVVQLAGNLGIAIDGEQARLMVHHARLVLQANQHMNLTAISDPHEFVVKHIVDSLVPLSLDGSLLSPGPSRHIVDVGSGAGFPGIPLAIVRGEHMFVCIEATRKKAMFLENVIAELGIINTAVEWGRAEELGHKPEYREQFDVGIARAVASLSTLAEYVLPLVRRGGEFLALKGPEVTRELNEARSALTVLGGGAAEIDTLVLPGGEHRSLVRVYKTGETPEVYPRRPGVPAKRPL